MKNTKQIKQKIFQRMLSLESRSICRTELDEGIGITGAKRGGRLLVDRGRRATKPVISMASLATGDKWFGSPGSSFNFYAVFGDR